MTMPPLVPTRRTVLLALLSTGLAACGFQPRGWAELPPAMQRVSLSGNRELAAALERLLRQNGGQRVGDAKTATLRLTVTDYRDGRREVVIDPRARLREVELTLQVRIRAEDAQGTVLLKDEAFEAARMMHYDPANLLGRGEEEARLRGEMHEIVAQSMLVRLRQRTTRVSD
ncbi:MAG: hypothetical protein FNT29_07580 [Halothiobacillaceae bacterium]|nr:MAG: hypothetical protein FNT29_07580 [Halothiobacillaceae bacterium]